MKTYATDTQLEKKRMEEEMKQGVAASEAGDKESAERIFRGIVERNPDALEAWVWLGWTSASVDDAEAAFKQAAELDPSNEESQLGLRWVASQREAADADESAPEPEPPALSTGTSPTLVQASPQSAPKLTFDPPAEEVSEEWDAEAMLAQGRAATQRGDKESAYAIFKQMAERQPETADVWAWLGGTCSDMDEAEAAFRKALEIDPKHEGAGLGMRWAALRRQALASPETTTTESTQEAAVAKADTKTATKDKVAEKKAPAFKRWSDLSISARLLIVAVAIVWVALVVLLVTIW